MKIDFETRYHSGRRTYLYILVTECWWLIAIGGFFSWLAYAMDFGSLNAAASQFLANHADWYLDVGTIAEWSLLTGIGFLIVAYLRVSVEYRRYTFFVDDHAFHLRRGLLRVQEITIPYAQISNVHIEQPYHWRLFGLAKLDITISSSREALRAKKRREFLIPVIDRSIARALSRFLVQEASGYDDDEEEYDDEDEYDDDEDADDYEIEENRA
jgi:uncharacterized membrane protein YdbT with pleckstrin-like domain